jgi:hypothetical protein
MGAAGRGFEVCPSKEMCLAYSNSDWLVGIWPGTGTVYGHSDKANDDENDNDRDLLIIEELLLTKLQEQGFITEDRGLDKTGGVKGVALERGSSVDQSRLAQSNNSGGSSGKRTHYIFCYGNRRLVFFWHGIDNLIILLRDDDSSASEAEVNNVSLCAESIELDAGLFDSPENAVGSITLALPCSSDRWHDINDFPETVPCLPLAE